MVTKAVSYLRVSGKGQIRGDGFPRQREVIAAYAKTNGLELVQEFRDEGVRGATELAHREGLAALLDRLESNGVDLVLVERSDRLARDLMVGEVMLGQFRDIGVQVIEADSGTDLTVANEDPTRVLIRQVLGAVAQFDKSVMVLKLRAARERIRRRGDRCEGRKPYGDRPGESHGLERLKALHRKPRKEPRMSYSAIARQLNAEGVPTRSGVPWSKGSVHAVAKRLRLAT